MFLYVFLGPAWLYCVNAWGWLLAKSGGKSGLLVFACWLDLGLFNPLCSRDTWVVLWFSSCRWASLGVGLCVQPLFISRSCEGSAQKLSLWLPSAGTKQRQQVPVLKAVCPSLSAGKGEKWLWFEPSGQVRWVLDWALWVDPGDKGLSKNPEVYSALLYLNVLKTQVLFGICLWAGTEWAGLDESIRAWTEDRAIPIPEHPSCSTSTGRGPVSSGEHRSQGLGEVSQIHWY